MRLVIILLFLTLVQAFIPNALSMINANDLQSGDVLLLPMNCLVCQKIEMETNSSFAHVGVVLGPSGGEIMVAHALKKVEAVPLSDFMDKKDNRDVLVLRPVQFLNLSVSTEVFFRVFYHNFDQLEYDGSFYWEPEDVRRPKLYCAEFVMKFLNLFLDQKLAPEPMVFKRDPAFWMVYFSGHVPNGEPGASPATFERSDEFVPIGHM